MLRFAFVSLLILAAACADQEQKALVEGPEPLLAMGSSLEDPGKKLMESYCYACHGPKAKGNERLAPPMFAIKKHYLDEGISRKDFINSIVDWAKNPSSEKARMPGAIERFGVMPYQAFPEDSLKMIAAYMFDNELVRPGHHRQGKGKGGHGKGGHGHKKNMEKDKE